MDLRVVGDLVNWLVLVFCGVGHGVADCGLAATSSTYMPLWSPLTCALIDTKLHLPPHFLFMTNLSGCNIRQSSVLRDCSYAFDIRYLLTLRCGCGTKGTKLGKSYENYNHRER